MRYVKLVCLLSFVLFTNLFYFRSIGMFGLFLALAGFTFFSVGAYSHNLKHSDTLLLVSTFVYFILAGIAIQNRSNITVQQILLVSSFFVGSTLFFISAVSAKGVLALSQLVLSPFYNLGGYLNGLDEYTRNKNTFEKTFGLEQVRAHSPQAELSKVVKKVGVGLLMSIPILFVLVSLFAQADPIFSSILNQLIKVDSLQPLIWRVIFSTAVFVLCMPLVSIKERSEVKNITEGLSKLHFVSEYIVVMSLVSTVIFAFIIVQWRFIFVPSVSGVDLAQFGIQTYSEYVNKGFTQLLAAAAFIFSLVWFGLLQIRRRAGKSANILRSINIFVLAEFAVLLLSVFRRIWLYQHYHGMTLIRYYGGFFILALSLFTFTLFLRHLVKSKLVFIEGMMAILLLFGFAQINIEKYIALEHPPKVNEQIDYMYLSRLSADGYEGWLKAHNFAQENLAQNYPESTISADNRKKIAYSGIVVQHLSDHYLELLRKYATKDEQKEVVRKIYEYQEQRNSETLAYLRARHMTLTAENDISSSAYAIQELDSGLQQLQTLKQKLDGDDFELSKNTLGINSVSIKGIRGEAHVFYDYEKCGTLQVCTGADPTARLTHSMFTTNTYFSDNKVSRMTPLDRLFTRNQKEAQTWQKMKTDISIDSLLTLQKAYFDLQQRISVQPDSERGYDADVSLDTPFLR